LTREIYLGAGQNVASNKIEGKIMKKFFITVIAVTGLLLGSGVSAPIRGQTKNVQSQTQNSHPAHPGDINYVEGQASIGDQALSPDSVGSAGLDRGQSLITRAGKVEILLTPGVFLRVADNSTVKMISPDLANTEVRWKKAASWWRLWISARKTTFESIRTT
jgi:hypothetical protein